MINILLNKFNLLIQKLGCILISFADFFGVLNEYPHIKEKIPSITLMLIALIALSINNKK